jgi:peptidoglycan/LPS O-acetylase OafA/YrhL
VALAFGRGRATTLVLLGLYALTFLALAMGWVLPGMNPWFRGMGIIGRSPVLLCGILAAWLWLRHGAALRTRLAAQPWLAAGGGDVLLLVVLLLLGLLLRWTCVPGFGALETTRWFLWHVPEGVLWTLVLLIVLLVPLRSKRLLSNAVLARLGVLSYSIYVLHQPILSYSMWAWRRLLPQSGLGWTPYTAAWFVLAVTLCIGLASLTYRWIERPFLIRKARLDAGSAVARARAA